MKSSVLVGALVLCLAVVLTVSLMPRDALATTVYKYTWTFDWWFAGKNTLGPSDTDLTNDAITAMDKESYELFASEMAAKGYWYKVDDVSSICSISQKEISHLGFMVANYSGTTILHFESDESIPRDITGYGANPSTSSYTATSRTYSLLSAPVQPAQGWELAVLAILTAIVEAMAAHTLITAILVAVVIGAIVLTVAAWILHMNGGVAGAIAPGLAGEIITAIIAIGIVLALIPTAPAIMERLLPKRKGNSKKSSRK